MFISFIALFLQELHLEAFSMQKIQHILHILESLSSSLGSKSERPPQFWAFLAHFLDIPCEHMVSFYSQLCELS